MDKSLHEQVETVRKGVGTVVDQVSEQYKQFIDDPERDPDIPVEMIRDYVEALQLLKEPLQNLVTTAVVNNIQASVCFATMQAMFMTLARNLPNVSVKVYERGGPQ